MVLLYDIKTCFANALKYGLFLTPKVDAFVSYSEFKTRSFKFIERDFTTLKPCNDLTHSFPMHPFSNPWKHLTTVRFSDVFKE